MTEQQQQPLPIRRTEPKDVFLHLLAIVALYASAISFTTLAFQLINIQFPDVLEGGGYYYSRQDSLGVIRFSIAALVVLFPVYILTMRYLKRMYAHEPEKQQLRVRKWLIHFTLFIAALVIIGDLVGLIYRFLGGELTERFLLKVVAVFFVAGSIFGYYYLHLRDASKKAMGYFLYGVPLVVVALIVTGFFAVGSPAEKRLKDYDDRRIQDFQFLQAQIIDYWMNKRALPSQLLVLQDPLRGISIPSDPQTGSQYEYLVLDDKELRFSLCTTFNRPSESYVAGKSVPRAVGGPYYYEMNEYWQHPDGRYCFDRMIDKDVYTPKEPPKIP